jgi:hypothetical protein
MKNLKDPTNLLNTTGTKSLMPIKKKRPKLKRTTFSLSFKSQEYLKELAKYNKITDLFRTIYEFWTTEYFSNLYDESIGCALSDEEEMNLNGETTIPKSFAIDAHINKFLNDKANELGVSRNILLAGSLYQIHFIQSIQRNSAVEESKKGLNMLKKILEQIEQSELDLGEKLGNDSEIVKAFGVVPITLYNLITEVEECVQNNQEFDADII